MHFERLTSADDSRFSAAMEGYAVSFPPHEQREPASQRAIMTDPAYRFNLIYDGGAPVGAMLCWETETFIYVEHFFILPHLRGHACGSRALALLGGRGKTVILERSTRRRTTSPSAAGAFMSGRAFTKTRTATSTRPITRETAVTTSW